MDLITAGAFGALVVSMLVVPSFRAIAWASIRHPRTTSVLVLGRRGERRP